jgi:basic amino acid/polyamine antiporter, APA family
MKGLLRKLGLPGAIAIGLSSMIGAGVFAVFAPAAQSAGSWLLLSLAIAGLVAWLNATSSAQLAAQFPTSGGTYAFGREKLGPWWGYLAGWSFVVGKLASAAAISLTFAAYVLPESWQRPGAVCAVLLLTWVNMRGITRTAAVAFVIVVPVVVVLAIFIGVGVSFPAEENSATTPDVYGILQAAGLMFFAFAGYARLATLGEEVKEPKKTIPRAILFSLFTVFALYAGVGWAMLHILGPEQLASSSQPIMDALDQAGLGSWNLVIAITAAMATLGSLLALIAGIGRTMFAMGRNRDLPQWLSATHPVFNVPHHAELVVGVIVAGLVCVTDLRGAIGFSSAGVLFYYLVTNLAAFRQDLANRIYPRVLSISGALLCAGLVVTLPIYSVVSAGAVLLVGVVIRLVGRRYW